MAEAAGVAREHQPSSARDARGPFRPEGAHAVRIVLDLVQQVVPVALASHEVQLELRGLQEVYLLQEVERELAGHDLGARPELDYVPRPLGEVRRADALRVPDLLYGVTVVDVEHMARDVSFEKPRVKIGRLVSNEQSLHSGGIIPNPMSARRGFGIITA